MLDRGVPETPKTMKAIVIALGFSPELNGKLQLLKKLYTLVTGNREIKLLLIRKLSP